MDHADPGLEAGIKPLCDPVWGSGYPMTESQLLLVPKVFAHSVKMST
jgi:hypothetical protein